MTLPRFVVKKKCAVRKWDGNQLQNVNLKASRFSSYQDTCTGLKTPYR